MVWMLTTLLLAGIPWKVQELRAALWQQPQSQVLAIMRRVLGPANDIGSGAYVYRWTLGGGTITVVSSDGKTTRQQPVYLCLGKTYPLYDKILLTEAEVVGSYRMVAPIDKGSPEMSRYILQHYRMQINANHTWKRVIRSATHGTWRLEGNRLTLLVAKADQANVGRSKMVFRVNGAGDKLAPGDGDKYELVRIASGRRLKR